MGKEITSGTLWKNKGNKLRILIIIRDVAYENYAQFLTSVISINDNDLDNRMKRRSNI